MNDIAEQALAAQTAEALGELDEAIAIWRALSEADEDVRWKLRLGDVLASAEIHDEAASVQAEAVTDALARRDVLGAIVAACAVGADVGHLFDGRRDLSILGQLSANQFAQIGPALRRRALADGEVLMEEGESGRTLYLLAAGHLTVTRRDGNGREIQIGRLGPGAVVGEMALVLDGPRTATASAAEPAELIEIDVGVLQRIAAENPEINEALTAYTEARLMAAVVASSPLLRGVAPGARAEAIAGFSRVTAAPGDVLATEGEPGPGIHVVVSGEVTVRRTVDGEPATVAILGPGDVFGEISLLIDGPATATVIAARDSTLLRLSADEFASLCDRNPAVRAQMKQLSDRRLEENRFVYEEVAFVLEIEEDE